MADLPTWFKNLATIGSFISNVFLVFYVVVGIFFDLPNKTVIACAVIVLVLASWLFNYFTKTTSQESEAAINLILTTGIPSGEERKRIADHVRQLDKKYWRGVVIKFVLLAIAVLGIAGYWGWRHLNTKVPDRLPIAKADPYQPSINKDILTHSPFLAPIIADLEAEGKKGAQSRIVLFTTDTVHHPTPPFVLDIYYEELAYDITGYAFLRRANTVNQYEPVPVRFDQPGQMSLDVPRCEAGDVIFLVSRLTLNKAPTFPTILSDKTRTKTHAP